MNETAKELGMTRSTFKNPHGLTERGQLSTARDIATIMQALDNDFADFMHTFSEWTQSFLREEIYSIQAIAW